jgi:hypothetical protein
MPPCRSDDQSGLLMTAPTDARPPRKAAAGHRQDMRRDVEAPTRRHDVSAEPFENARRNGDASVLAIIGMFAMVDAVLVVLWNLL